LWETSLITLRIRVFEYSRNHENEQRDCVVNRFWMLMSKHNWNSSPKGAIEQLVNEICFCSCVHRVMISPSSKAYCYSKPTMSM
jgi:hypothetical protein